MYDPVKKGTTNKSIYFLISSGLTLTAADLQYTREQEAPSTKVDLTLLTFASSSHDDNKCIYVDDTNSPGLVRVDVPDAALASASGVGQVEFIINHAAGTWRESVPLRNSLYSDAGCADAVWDEAQADHLTTTSMGYSQYLASVQPSVAPTLASISDAVWDELRAGHLISGSFGQYTNANLERINAIATADGLTFQTMFTNMIAALQGDVARSSNTYTYKKQDGATTAFDFTLTSIGRS